MLRELPWWLLIRVVLGVLSSWLFGASLNVLCVAPFDGI